MRTTSALSAILLFGGALVSALPAAAPVPPPAVQLDRRVNINLTEIIEKGKDLIDNVNLPDVELPDGDEVGDIWDNILSIITGGKKSS